MKKIESNEDIEYNKKLEKLKKWEKEHHIEHLSDVGKLEYMIKLSEQEYKDEIKQKDKEIKELKGKIKILQRQAKTGKLDIRKNILRAKEKGLIRSDAEFYLFIIEQMIRDYNDGTWRTEEIKKEAKTPNESGIVHKG